MSILQTDRQSSVQNPPQVTPPALPSTPGARVVGIVRADMHAHSHASSAPVVPILGRIDCPESYSHPERVYEQAKSRGMNLVALTDHDTIRGAMELVDKRYDDVIVGEEVTVRFPEDRCKLHVLVWGLTGDEHEQIGELDLRSDVYNFAAWLRERELAHSLAHPLYIQNNKLTLWHLERAALLFKGFETLNGAHSGAHRDALVGWLDSLTPAGVLGLIDQHGIEPHWPRIWRKAITAGSDDHALLNIGRTWTSVPVREDTPVTTKTFLNDIMGGRSSVGGQAGHSSLLAHQLMSVGMQHYAHKVHEGVRPRGQAIGSAIVRFAGADAERPSKLSLAVEAGARTLMGRKPKAKSLGRALQEHLGPLLVEYPEVRRALEDPSAESGPPMADHEAMARFADDLSERLARTIASPAMKSVRDADASGIADALVGYGALVAMQIPYLFSLFHQNKERRLIRQVQHKADPTRQLSTETAKVMLFTDTLGDINGVCRFIKNMGERAHAAGRQLDIMTSTRLELPDVPYIHNFDPVFAMPMPKYENLEMTLPPLTRMLRLVDTIQPDAIHISTPGSVGLVGLIAAKMLRVPIVGTYHTDFPAYIDHLFDDPVYTKVCSEYMRFFYKPFGNIFTRSDDYMDAMVDAGLERDRMLRLTPGVALTSFDAAHRDPAIWERLGVSQNSVKMLYCGRVSIEKNLPLLTDIWPRIRAACAEAGTTAELIVVGDGPYRTEMEARLRHEGAHFLGFRHGDELSTLYASSDLFAFPSCTDTLGQVVLESQASGIPVVVTDQGGPKEVVDHGETGFVLSADDPSLWVETITRLATNADERRPIGATAAERAQRYSIDASFEQFWETHVLAAQANDAGT